MPGQSSYRLSPVSHNTNTSPKFFVNFIIDGSSDGINLILPPFLIVNELFLLKKKHVNRRAFYQVHLKVL
jgi:hypothetical protein